MTTMKHKSLIAILGVILSGSILSCAVPEKSEDMSIKRLVFLNQSAMPLNDVRIYVQSTHEFVTCGYILPKSECSMGFPLREYQGNRFQVKWRDNNQQRTMNNIAMEIPGDLDNDLPVRAVIVFGENGNFSAKLQH